MIRLNFLVCALSVCSLVSCAASGDSGYIERYDQSPGPTLVPTEHGERSLDIPTDLRIMWSVQDPQEDRTWVTATTDAIDASERIFNTVDLRGKTKKELSRSLRFDLKADNYGYNAPFWPVDRGVLPVRIDNGAYGWQYNVYFDARGQVSKVSRKWIH